MSKTTNEEILKQIENLRDQYPQKYKSWPHDDADLWFRTQVNLLLDQVREEERESERLYWENKDRHMYEKGMQAGYIKGTEQASKMIADYKRLEVKPILKISQKETK